jgi:glycerophosphoryl diester phosphodiesterase
LVNKELVQQVHKLNLKLIPWTVNEITDIKKMIALNVDGIISDYPDRVIESIKNNKH